MKLKLINIFAVYILFLFSGCQVVFGPNHSNNPPERYAELRVGKDRKSELLIGFDIWVGLVTVEGAGGSKHGVDLYALLVGEGPIYVNPVLDSGPSKGAITVDQKNKRILIDVQRILSRPGDPEVTKPCEYNGAYSLKDVNDKKFYNPNDLASFK